MFVLYDILNDYSREHVPGKFQYGDLAHAKKRAVKNNDGQSISWLKQKGSNVWQGYNKHSEIINAIFKETNSIKNNPERNLKESLFIQIKKDLGNKKPTYKNVEKLLKNMGWNHNNAVRGSVDYVSTLQTEEHEINRNKNPVFQGYYVSPEKMKRIKAAVKFAGKSITWQSVAARPDTVDDFLAKVEPEMKKSLNKIGAVCPRCNEKTFCKVKTGGAECHKCGFGKLRPGQKGYKKNPESEIHELILWAENTESLNNQFYSIIKNLEKKAKKGNYNPVLAAKLWKYWIDEAVKSYNKEILGGGNSLRQNVFTVQDRKDAAIQVEQQWRDDIFRGDNPIKGKRKMAKKKRSAKQLANDKRLGRMAKARAKAKRGGARKKVVRRKVARKTNPKRTALKKSHLWIAFICSNKTVSFAYITDTVAARVGVTTNKASSVLFRTKKRAHDVAKLLAKHWPNHIAGVADADSTAAQIKAACKEGK